MKVQLEGSTDMGDLIFQYFSFRVFFPFLPFPSLPSILPTGFDVYVVSSLGAWGDPCSVLAAACGSCSSQNEGGRREVKLSAPTATNRTNSQSTHQEIEAGTRLALDFLLASRAEDDAHPPNHHFVIG